MNKAFLLEDGTRFSHVYPYVTVGSTAVRSFADDSEQADAPEQNRLQSIFPKGFCTQVRAEEGSLDPAGRGADSFGRLFRWTQNFRNLLRKVDDLSGFSAFIDLLLRLAMLKDPDPQTDGQEDGFLDSLTDDQIDELLDAGLDPDELEEMDDISRWWVLRTMDLDPSSYGLYMVP